MVSRRLGLECLESRRLLAGEVLVHVSTGDLIVRGDDESNQLDITQLPDGRFRVTALADTTLKTKTEAGLDMVTVDGVTDDVMIEMKAGGNTVTVHNATVPDELKMTGTTGADDFRISEVVAGKATVSTSRGANAVYISASRIGRDLSVRGGSDDDRVEIVDLQVDGKATIDTSSGGGIVGLQDVSIGTDLNVKSSSGGDVVGLKTVQVGRNLSIKTSSGDDRIGLADTQVHGAATIDGGSAGNAVRQDSVIVTGADIGGALKVKTAGGDDLIALGDAPEYADQLAGDFDEFFEHVAGDDIAAGPVVASLLDLNSGPGNDLGELHNIEAATVKAAFGSGGDWLNFDLIEGLTNLRLDGGSGFDHLQVGNQVEIPSQFVIRNWEEENFAEPIIVITSLPRYGRDGMMKGRILGADPAAHRVAPYIHIEGGGWWTKPTFDAPSVPIRPDGTFEADVVTGGMDHLAIIFCAALISADDDPPPQAAGSGRIPADLDAVAVDCEYRYGRIIEFAGYQWAVKEATMPAGPGGNLFSAASNQVYVDDDGLHLTVRQDRSGQWRSSEVILLDSLGYGTYSFETSSRQDVLDPNVTFGAYTWDSFGDDESGADANREIDFEDSRWGNVGAAFNAQMVIQPFGVPGNREYYAIPDLSGDPTLTRWFTWQAGQVDFVAARGSHEPGTDPGGDLIHDWSYAHDPASGHYVPTEGRESFRFNLWLNQPGGTSNGQGAEVVITGFNFT